MNTRFVVDENRVVYEVLEREVVVVNLDTGYYYILDDTAAAIWGRLVDGATPTEVVHALSVQYRVDGETIRDAVRTFVDQLAEERLLTASDREAPRQAEGDAAQMLDLGPSFAPPILHRYTDMAKLIQMDPIHDFDETGWPRRPIARDR